MEQAPDWVPTGWVLEQIEKKQRFAAVRARDGDACWRCNRPMHFDNPAHRKAATIEHVLPRSKGGDDDLANLRLCHVGCNRHLADHAPEQKERMRINRPAVEARR